MLGCQNLTETVFLAATVCLYSAFKRNVLTPGVEEMCLKNGSVEPARPCCFPVLRPGFRTPGLLLSTANHRNVSQTFVLIAFRATFTRIYHLPLPSRETWLENASHKWVRCSGQAMLFPCRSSLDARPRCVFIVVLSATF